MIWRRGKPEGGDPNQVLRDAREALAGLRTVLGDLRTHLDELEAEVRRQPDVEEV